MEAIFDHEKLDVYGLQLQFVAWTADFLIEASQSPVAHRRELLSQLDRACLSILLNSAEGNGKRHGLQRAKFFDDARGSALECAACLDASVAKRIAKSDRIHFGKQLLIRIVAMLINAFSLSVLTRANSVNMNPMRDPVAVVLRALDRVHRRPDM